MMLHRDIEITKEVMRNREYVRRKRGKRGGKVRRNNALMFSRTVKCTLVFYYTSYVILYY